jgi:hypothetical protein
MVMLGLWTFSFDVSRECRFLPAVKLLRVAAKPIPRQCETGRPADN